MAALLPTLLLASTVHSPPVVHGGMRAPRAWAASVRGQLWVCWEEAPRCWRPLQPPADRAGVGEDLPDDVDADETDDDDDAVDLVDPSRAGALGDIERVGFRGPGELVAVDAAGHAWTATRTDDVLRPAPGMADAVSTRRPRPLACSPTGALPLHDGRAWTWIAAACAGTNPRRCARVGPTLRAGRPTGLALGLGIELAVTRASDLTLVRDAFTPGVPASGTAAGVAVVASLRLAFDPRARINLRARWRGLRRAAVGDVELPAVPRGPLAASERAALRAAVCREGS